MRKGAANLRSPHLKLYMKKSDIVRLEITNPLEVYTTGDTVAGSVILDVPDNVDAVHNLQIVIRCNAFWVSHRELLFERLLESCEQEDKISKGRQRFPFTYVFGEESMGLPASELMECPNVNCGISWAVLVTVVATVKRGTVKHGSMQGAVSKEKKSLFNAYCFKFFPRNWTIDQALTRLPEKKEYKFDTHSVSIEGLPIMLTQQELLNLTVTLNTPAGLVYLRSVTAKFEWRATLKKWNDPGTPTLVADELLDKYNYSKFFCCSIQLDDFMKDIRLSRKAILAFESELLKIECFLVLLVEGAITSRIAIPLGGILPPRYMSNRDIQCGGEDTFQELPAYAK